MKRPSPPVCAGCMRPHVRLPSLIRQARRLLLRDVLRNSPADVTAYALALFDHVTIGVKVDAADASGQIHPAPDVPDGWTARGLAILERSVMAMANGIPA